MSTKSPTSPSSPKPIDFLKQVKELVGFLPWLVLTISVILDWVQDPKSVRILSLAGFIFYFIITYLFVFRPYGFDFKKKKDKTFWLWLGLFYIVSLVYLFWVGTWLSHHVYPLPPRPVNVHQRFDFESVDSLETWSLYQCGDHPCKGGNSPWSKVDNGLSLGSRPFTGAHNLTFRVAWEPGKEHVYSVQRSLDGAPHTDVISVRAYVSRVPENSHVQIGILAEPTRYDGVWPGSLFDILEPGWHELLLDLRRMSDKDGKPFNTRGGIEALHIDFTLPQIQGQTVQSIDFAIDDVALSRPTSFQLTHDQRGEGQTLFGFEKGDWDDWEVSDSRTATGVFTDSLSLSQEQSYRGITSLKLSTYLTQTEDSISHKGYFRYPWEGPTPLGGLVARIYIPEEAPGDGAMWANVFVDAGGDWQGNIPLFLTPGTWTTLVWDTCKVDWGTGDVVIGVQVGLNTGSYQGPIYLDDFEVFER